MDGGIDIPHSDKRFAGFQKDGKHLDADVHRTYIFGGHVANYMRVSAGIKLLVIGLVEVLIPSSLTIQVGASGKS